MDGPPLVLASVQSSLMLPNPLGIQSDYSAGCLPGFWRPIWDTRSFSCDLAGVADGIFSGVLGTQGHTLTTSGCHVGQDWK